MNIWFYMLNSIKDSEAIVNRTSWRVYPVGAISAHLAGDEMANSPQFGTLNKKDGMKDKFTAAHTKLAEIHKDKKK